MTLFITIGRAMVSLTGLASVTATEAVSAAMGDYCDWPHRLTETSALRVLFLHCTICHRAYVKFRTLLPRLLTILAVVSLLTAPMVTPSAAAMMVVDPMATTMAEMASMSDAMPCPSDQRQQLPDCQKSCPLATLCVAKCFPSASTTAAITLTRLTAADVIAPGNDVGRDIPASPPPPRPPRT